MQHVLCRASGRPSVQYRCRAIKYLRWSFIIANLLDVNDYCCAKSKHICPRCMSIICTCTSIHANGFEDFSQTYCNLEISLLYAECLDFTSSLHHTIRCLWKFLECIMSTIVNRFIDGPTRRVGDSIYIVISVAFKYLNERKINNMTSAMPVPFPSKYYEEKSVFHYLHIVLIESFKQIKFENRSNSQWRGFVPRRTLKLPQVRS